MSNSTEMLERRLMDEDFTAVSPNESLFLVILLLRVI